MSDGAVVMIGIFDALGKVRLNIVTTQTNPLLSLFWNAVVLGALSLTDPHEFNSMLVVPELSLVVS